MKSHTSEFKEEIKTLGKQQSVRITYTLNNEQIILTNEDINSATPNYEASLLKSVMKVLELDSNVSISKGTEIKFEYGLLVNGAYEYLNYGNYIVAKEPEKQEDTLSYKITCYDKMLYSMKDYEHIEVNYPCKIKKFLIELCKKIGLEFKDSTFANQDREFANELFMTINEDGTYSSMGYTYRDVLDQIAETTGGCICMTLDDKVEVRYINDTTYYKTIEGENINIQDSINLPFEVFKVTGNSVQGTRSGKNKFDKTAEDFKNGTTVGFAKKITLNLKPSTNYTCSTNDPINLSASTTNLLFGNSSNGVNKSTPRTYSTDESGNIDIFLRTEKIDEFYENYYIQVEEGNTATEYEKGGAMPSPKYPSEIQNVEGNIDITVCNNNLIGEQWEKLLYSVDGTPEYLNSPLYRSFKTKLKAGTYVYSYNADLTIIRNVNLTDQAILAISNKKFTLNKDTEISLGFRKTDNFNWDLGENLSDINFQLEKNVVTTEYIEHKSQTITFPLSEGQKLMKGDYLADDGIHHVRKQMEFDGTEGWLLYPDYETTYRYTFYRTYSDVLVSSKNLADLASNWYIGENSGQTEEGSKDKFTIRRANGGKNIYFFTPKTFIQATTKNEILAEWKSKLSEAKESGKALTLQYPLAEEVIEPYTPEQQEAYNQINSLYSYDEVTNIFSSNEISPIFNIQYAYEMETIDEEYINDVNVNFGEKYRAN